MNAQIPEDTTAEGFERVYLDPDEYRAEDILLRDWPSLSRLVAWSGGLESAIVEDAETISAEMLSDFRVRVDSLAAEPLPPFLEERADTVRVVFEALNSYLERAEAELAEQPLPAVTVEGEAVNTSERQRTLVTGNTAVTVPAGVRVGEEDSLPSAEVQGDAYNYIDYIAFALTELDRLVHLTRTTGREDPTEGPTDEAPSSPRGTTPSPPGQ